MSDTTNRQAYVFLIGGDIIQQDDEIFNYMETWVKIKDSIGNKVKSADEGYIRRPITLPTEQTDKLTIEQRITALEQLITPLSDMYKQLKTNRETNAQPTSDTCKWTMCQKMFMCINPHIGTEMNIYRVNNCPTCGKRIEVVE